MAITLPTRVDMGGGVTMFLGTFAHTAGAAEETFLIGSARIYDVKVTSQDASSKHSFSDSKPFSESVSGSTNTVTVYALETVTSGKIVVLAKS